MNLILRKHSLFSIQAKSVHSYILKLKAEHAKMFPKRKPNLVSYINQIKKYPTQEIAEATTPKNIKLVKRRVKTHVRVVP